MSGFIFTSIVLLLTLLPDPSQPLAQLTLFVLSTISSFIVLQIYSEEVLLGYCVKIAPKFPNDYPIRALNMLSALVWILFGAAIVLMFLVLGLIFLALATTITYAMMSLLGYFKLGKLLLRAQRWKRVDLYEDTSQN